MASVYNIDIDNNFDNIIMCKNFRNSVKLTKAYIRNNEYNDAIIAFINELKKQECTKYIIYKREFLIEIYKLKLSIDSRHNRPSSFIEELYKFRSLCLCDCE